MSIPRKSVPNSHKKIYRIAADEVAFNNESNNYGNNRNRYNHNNNNNNYH